MKLLACILFASGAVQQQQNLFPNNFYDISFSKEPLKDLQFKRVDTQSSRDILESDFSAIKWIAQKDGLKPYEPFAIAAYLEHGASYLAFKVSQHTYVPVIPVALYSKSPQNELGCIQPILEHSSHFDSDLGKQAILNVIGGASPIEVGGITSVEFLTLLFRQHWIDFYINDPVSHSNTWLLDHSTGTPVRINHVYAFRNHLVPDYGEVNVHPAIPFIDQFFEASKSNRSIVDIVHNTLLEVASALNSQVNEEVLKTIFAPIIPLHPTMNLKEKFIERLYKIYLRKRDLLINYVVQFQDTKGMEWDFERLKISPIKGLVDLNSYTKDSSFPRYHHYSKEQQYPIL